MFLMLVVVILKIHVQADSRSGQGAVYFVLFDSQ